MTLKELSEIAGVSPATISLVLNNKRGVGAQTREHVQQVLAKYNYTLPKRAPETTKNLLFLKYSKHGMIVEENANFISTIMDSIETDCQNEGYSLSIAVSKGELADTLKNINSSNYSGLILLGTELDSSSYPLLQSISIPYVVVDNFMPHLDCNCIAINNKEISYQAVKYLAALGHQSIGYFCSDIPIQNFGERAEGFEKAIQDLELSFSPANRICLTPTLLGSYENMKQYLSQGLPLPTCAFADNDTIAIGAIKALKEYNYRIPQDISIIGFDNIHFAAINSPALSTMNIPKKLIGSMALKHLQLAMDDPSMKNIKTRIGGSLIIRHST